MEQIPVTREEFERSLAVWMAVAPRSIFRDLEKQLKLHADKRAPDPEPAFRRALADFCAAKLEQAGWQIIRPQRGGIFEAAAKASHEH